jgi:hypothetical protein
MAISCFGVEYPLLNEPRGIHADELGGGKEKRPVLVCEWGAVSTTVERSGEDCDKDYLDLLRYLSSPEWMAIWHDIVEKGIEEEKKIAHEAIEKVKKEYGETVQEIGLTQQPNITHRTVGIQPWQRRIPLDIRKNLVVLVVDFSKTEQIAWAIQAVSRQPHAQLYACAWNSQAEVDAVCAQYSALAQTHKIRVAPDTKQEVSAVDTWLAGWQIMALPAAVSFPDSDHVLIQEGLQ